MGANEGFTATAPLFLSQFPCSPSAFFSLAIRSLRGGGKARSVIAPEACTAAASNEVGRKMQLCNFMNTFLTQEI